ncbi:MAG: hypothetical protein AAF267_06255, partial [Deinococcota bacterium]
MDTFSVPPRLNKVLYVCFLVTGLYLLLSTSVAQVTNLDDAGPGSLRDVMAAAADGDTITFQAGLSGTINTASELNTALPNLTIDATGATITVDGQGTHRVFNHTSNGTFTIINMTIQNGNAGGGDGGGVRSNRNIAILNSTVTNNRAGRDGGGISGRDITVTNSTVSDNVADDSGGGIEGQDVVVTNSTVSGNRSETEDGGGILSRDNTTIISSRVFGNRTRLVGGAASSTSSKATLMR